jgi:hypothetical protein
MVRLFGTLVASSVGFLVLGSAVPPSGAPVPAPSAEATSEPAPAATAEPAKPPKPRPPSALQALETGVLIVVSLPTQHAVVFKDGAEWGAARVSTGRRGHSTPTGVFPILQKSKDHRSTLYNDAPMPYMQRLTWGGVALHGGNVSRLRASHGCIRLPHAFAKRLFAITSYRSTAVLITQAPVRSAGTALALVGGGRTRPTSEPRVELAERTAPARVELAAREVAPPAATIGGPVQTIQLAAAANSASAAGLWDDLVHRRPELSQLQHQVVPAVVNARQYYRLRATGPGAAAICKRAASEGMACFRVAS